MKGNGRWRTGRGGGGVMMGADIVCVGGDRIGDTDCGRCDGSEDAARVPCGRRFSVTPLPGSDVRRAGVVASADREMAVNGGGVSGCDLNGPKFVVRVDCGCSCGSNCAGCVNSILPNAGEDARGVRGGGGSRGCDFCCLCNCCVAWCVFSFLC